MGICRAAGAHHSIRFNVTEPLPTADTHPALGRGDGAADEGDLHSQTPLFRPAQTHTQVIPCSAPVDGGLSEAF